MLKSWPMWKRLTLAGAVYTILLGIISLFMILAKNEPIDFAAQELKGNELQRPAQQILHLLANQRILPSQENLTETEKAFEAFKAAYDAQAQDLQFTEAGLASRKREHVNFKTVFAEWQEARDLAKKEWTGAASDKFAHLIADFRTIITHLGDTSNLILDPDLDSYYLMDVTLLALPQAQDRIQEAAAYISSFAEGHMLSEDEKMKMSLYATLLKMNDLDRVAADVQTVLNEDANFYGARAQMQSDLPKHVAAYDKAMQESISVLNKFVKEGSVNERARASEHEPAQSSQQHQT